MCTFVFRYFVQTYVREILSKINHWSRGLIVFIRVSDFFYLLLYFIYVSKLKCFNG